MIKKIFLGILLIAESLILYTVGADTAFLKDSILLYLIIHGVLLLIVFLAFQIVPIISIPAVNLERRETTSKALIISWMGVILLILFNLPVTYVLKSATGFKQIFPMFLLIYNNVLAVSIMIWRRLRSHTVFVYQLAKVAKKDKKEAARIITTDPEILEAAIGVLPFGFVTQFALGQMKDKVLDIRKNKKEITDKDLEELYPELEKMIKASEEKNGK